MAKPTDIPFDLAAWRTRSRVTQTQLAAALGVTVGTIWRWERDGIAPRWFPAWARQYVADLLVSLDRDRIDTLAIPGLDRGK